MARKARRHSNTGIYHVMLATMEKELSDVVKPLAISYARYCNTKYSRCGYLLQDRFKSESVDDLCRLVSESVDDDCSPLEKVDTPSDLEVTEMLLEECHGMPIERISSLPKQNRDKILIPVLQKGAGIRQLSKLSAVGFSIIRRLKNVSNSPSP